MPLVRGEVLKLAGGGELLLVVVDDPRDSGKVLESPLLIREVLGEDGEDARAA